MRDLPFISHIKKCFELILYHIVNNFYCFFMLYGINKSHHHLLLPIFIFYFIIFRIFRSHKFPPFALVDRASSLWCFWIYKNIFHDRHFDGCMINYVISRQTSSPLLCCCRLSWYYRKLWNLCIFFLYLLLLLFEC